MQTLPSAEDLRCFCEVARLASFKGAARALALTPGAVSQRIRNLEALLGVALFARTTRSVALTLQGHAFLAHAPVALAALERALRAGRGESEALPLELHLGTRHELGMSWVVPMLPGLKRALPAITFHLYFGSGPDLFVARALERDRLRGDLFAPERSEARRARLARGALRARRRPEAAGPGAVYAP
jgi:DNA-binding transcriptional LysR family regulator